VKCMRYRFLTCKLIPIQVFQHCIKKKDYDMKYYGYMVNIMSVCLHQNSGGQYYLFGASLEIL